MPDATVSVENFLAEKQALEDHRQSLIAAILGQRDAALAAFDAQLASLGHTPTEPRNRSHHKSSSPRSSSIVRKPAA